MDIRLKVDVLSLANLKAQLRRDQVRMLIQFAAAINDTIRHVRSAASRLIRKSVPLTKKHLDRQFKIRQARADSLVAEMTIDDRRLPLKAFKARQTKAGVTVKFNTGGSAILSATNAKGNERFPLRSAFISKEMGGHVFTRTTTKRFPLAKLFGPKLLDVYNAEKIPEQLEVSANNHLRKRLDYRFGLEFNQGDYSATLEAPP